MTKTDIEHNLSKICQQITLHAEQRRKTIQANQSVTLITVSKKQSLEAIKAAYAAGQRDFGENYVQEGIQKILASQPDMPDACWHFIGHLQSNKSQEVATHFDWVHTIDRLKIAKRLSDQRPTSLPPLNICLQINIDNAANKAGIPATAATELCAQVAGLPNLRLRGLMAIPEPGNQAAFPAMEALFAALQKIHHLDTLSMGMSSDFATAIQHGATHVRIGTAIFGARTNP